MKRSFSHELVINSNSNSYLHTYKVTIPLTLLLKLLLFLALALVLLSVTETNSAPFPSKKGPSYLFNPGNSRSVVYFGKPRKDGLAHHPGSSAGRLPPGFNHAGGRK